MMNSEIRPNHADRTNNNQNPGVSNIEGITIFSNSTDGPQKVVRWAGARVQTH